MSMTSEQQTAENLHALGVLARSTAHDLNNYMAVILSFVDVALASLAATDPVREDLEEIRTAAQLAVATTKSLVANAAVAPLLHTD